MRVVIRNARVLTMLPGVPAGSLGSAAACGLGVDAAVNPGPLRGAMAGELGVIARGDGVVEDGVVVSLGAAASRSSGGVEIDARGRVLMPGFVDAHTHALWAGDRLDEWDMKRRGVSYLDILKAGGGIMSTVRAVRAASEESLAESLHSRLASMLREGTTTVEVKSGYGLTTADELKMLRVIGRYVGGRRGIEASGRRVGDGEGVTWVVPTALIGHAIDGEQPDFVVRTIGETLDAVHAEFPGAVVDAYCESGAWSLEQCARLFARARSLGHPFRVHTDQFNELGMTRWAVEHGAVSVDHLEASSIETLRAVAESGTFGVMLPCAGFHTDGRYGDGRRFLDEGGALVIATNVNPGSAPCASMPMAVALAVRFLRLSPAEALTACTRNAAALLGLTDRGVIGPGARADLILLKHTDERMLAYEFGGDPVEAVVAGGRVVRSH
ncbi:MAG: imidazolonepropionase [Planctomycetes bacterium]|nr:imidazolonepropionase [Planctomycetota bacterium]